MNRQLKQVKEFHKKFKTGIIRKSPGIPPSDVVIRDHRLIKEEFLELQAEMFPTEGSNIQDIAKEMVDLLYVIYGAAISYGLEKKLKEVFDEVHKSNMSKLTKDGKVVKNAVGKVMKGEGYKPADLSKIIKKNEKDSLKEDFEWAKREK